MSAAPRFEDIDEASRLTDEELHRKFFSPEAREHFRRKYAEERELPRGDEPTYGEPDE